ncbi:non-ribosomal peptide synthetase [uncultured Rhodoblastus sp.]|uniref:non-ribosomal peptide synthetase n=1 Tax=uncultured Rhodoblastus sp. TaxID=543037 RepID=UPI0025D7DF06|nr:non-ribosomal peptide synthetase [uncultured Rhodoblastus sp.]
MPYAEHLREQSDYWRGALADAPAVLDLPTDRPRPAHQSLAGAFVALELDEGLTAKLETLGRRHGACLFMILLAGWGALLARLSGQDAVVIGTRAACIGRREVEPAPSAFFNSLALRLDLSGGQTIGALIERVKARVLEAEYHRDLPFEKMAEALGVPRSLAHTPVFQAMFDWRPFNEAGLGFDMPVRPRADGSPCIAKFDVTLSLAECGARVVGGLEYATALFDRETMERHAGYLRRLLEAMTEGDDQVIDRLPLLGEAERHRQLVEWNATGEEYPSDKCMHELFEAQAARMPEAVALVFQDEQLTYGALNASANRLARHLQTLGVGPGDLVALCLERGLDMVMGLLAIHKAGGAYVPLDPSFPAERLALMLEDAAPKAALTHGPARAALREALAGLTIKPSILDIEAEAFLWAGAPDSDVDPASIGLTVRHLAYVIFTSGSTGRPKGVMVEHRGLVNCLCSMRRLTGFRSSDRMLALTTIGFDIAALELFMPLIGGAPAIVADRATASDPGLMEELIRRQKLTLMQATPSTWRMLVEAGWTGAAGLKALCGGEPLPAALAADVAARAGSLMNVYGPTETTIWSVVSPVGGSPSAQVSVPIGRPMANTRIYLLDAHLQPVPTGSSGEIYIGGDGVARGYLNRPDLTGERFLPSPFVEGDRLYRTGDLARYRCDGNIEFLGRNDFQVKIRGFRIELGEIEARLAEHEGIREAAVLAREILPGEKRLVAYYTAAREDFEAGRLRDYLSARLPEYMVPSAYVHLDAMPLTPNGKLDRKALPEPDAEAYIARGYESPEGATEEMLARIWARALGIARVGRHDNFFELGGHSLLAIKVVTQIKKASGEQVALRTLFFAPTVAELAREIQKGDRTRRSNSLLPLFVNGSEAPLFMVHWVERELARHLGRRRPIYGLSYGLAGVHGEDDDTAPEGVEAVASHYIEEMRSVQPQGPYRIVGHSAGGLIAYEMAQQLHRAGESVVFLGLLGTYAPIWRQRRHLLPLPRMLLNLVKTPPNLLLYFYTTRIERSLRTFLFRRPATRKFMSAPSVQKLKLHHIIAPPYEPEPYPGLVHLFVETTPPMTVGRAAPPPPETGWKDLALGGLEIHYLPGDHMDMVKDPLAGVAAEAIERALLAAGDPVVAPTNKV